jgi:ankyrin repeat protein
MDTPLYQLNRALAEDNTSAAEAALKHREVVAQINSGPSAEGKPLLLDARSAEMVEVLIRAGASIEPVSEYWAPGFGLDHIPRSVSEALLESGAAATIHAAAALGLAPLVGDLLDGDPGLLDAPGGDGGTPLHFARTIEVAEILVSRGAEPDARDQDHRSTPAQWHVSSAPEIARYLLNSGAEPDIFLAVGLGDIEMARAVLASDPKCVTYRIGNNSGPFPGIGFEETGGTILQWELGFNLAPQEVAMRLGHRDIYKMLMETTPKKHQLLVACMLADHDLAAALSTSHSALVDTFDEEDRMLLAKACWETNNDTEVIRLMIESGFPLGIPEVNHGYSPLHNAAWSGNAEVVRLLLAHGHPVDLVDPQYNSTAAGYAIHSAVEARRNPDGDFGGVIDALIAAGLDDCLSRYPVDHKAIDTVLERHLAAR